MTPARRIPAKDRNTPKIIASNELRQVSGIEFRFGNGFAMSFIASMLE